MFNPTFSNLNRGLKTHKNQILPLQKIFGIDKVYMYIQGNKNYGIRKI